MNLLHMKYALAVAETNSINKAADNLLVGAPALSRAIRELEVSLGVTLFERSSKGMFLTPDGDLFVRYAKKALKQVDDIEELFKSGTTAKKHFSISVPRASYITDAFVNFTNKIAPLSEAEILYEETNASRVIKNILQEDYKLGILRYNEQYDGYYKTMMNEKGLSSEIIAEFKYVAVMSKNSPLNAFSDITFDNLNNYIEISYADLYVPPFPVADIKKAEIPNAGHCRIFIFDRGSQFELLSKNHNTYVWTSAVPHDILDRYGLVQREVMENKCSYKDVLIHRNSYKFSEFDKMFIEELVNAKRRIFGNGK